MTDLRSLEEWCPGHYTENSTGTAGRCRFDSESYLQVNRDESTVQITGDPIGGGTLTEERAKITTHTDNVQLYDDGTFEIATDDFSFQGVID